MACGGTNFGFMGGGEWEGAKSTGIVSSYDYAAPITEGGDKGPKFGPIRAVIHKHFPSHSASLPDANPVAAQIAKAEYGMIKFDSVARLFDNLWAFNSTTLLVPQNMEPLGQGYGYIMYEANVTLSTEEVERGQIQLTAPGLADRGLAFVGGELQGVIGSWVPSHSLQLNVTEHHTVSTAGADTSEEVPSTLLLRLLVSNEGRQSGELVSLVKNGKGILGAQPALPVTVGSHALHAMRAIHLSLPEPASRWSNKLDWTLPKQSVAGPSFWKATLNATGSDATFLTTDGWGHGVVFINGVNIGKFTCRGPSRSLYVPTGVLHVGQNTLVVFETDQDGVAGPGAYDSSRTMQSVASGPLWASTIATSLSMV
jgi:beta-galactosidase